MTGVVWIAFSVFFWDMVLSDARATDFAKTYALVVWAGATAFIADRVIVFTTHLDVTERGIALRGLLVRREIRWEDVRRVEVGSADLSLGRMLVGAVGGILGLVGWEGFKIPLHTGTPRGDSVPVIRIRGRDRASSLTLVTCYDWSAARTLRRHAIAREIPTN